MSNFAESDTIAAIATAPGAAGVAVVRLSGPEAWQVAERVIRGGAPLGSRTAGTFFHGRIVDPKTDAPVDDALILLFRAPASFTGEDVVELQGHGGVVAPQAVLRVVLAAGARLANPGEFTRRAFLNGRIDLTQAEAVMDLVQARTERAAQVARAQLAGALGAACAACYEEVAGLCAEVEARLDFESDELPQRVKQEELKRVAGVREKLAGLLSTWRESQLLRSGALVVIGGCPNAGKSSLLNALLGWNRAIVSSSPGTTRDTIEESLELNGIQLRLVDTAGLRDVSCPVEQEGVRRAGSALAQADLMIYLLDGSRPLAEQHPQLFEKVFGTDTSRVIVALNKTDLPRQLTTAAALQGLRHMRPTRIIELSALTGQGLAELRQAMVEKLGLEQQAPTQPSVSERHRDELRLADQALDTAQKLLGQDDQQLVLAAIKLKDAAEALGRITGNHYSLELLDRIFARFCLGK